MVSAAQDGEMPEETQVARRPISVSFVMPDEEWIGDSDKSSAGRRQKRHNAMVTR